MVKCPKPNIEWERFVYPLKNGGEIEIIREKVINNDIECFDDFDFNEGS